MLGSERQGHQAEKLDLEGIRRFVSASEEIRFESADRGQVYAWVEGLLIGQQYAQQGRAARGLLRLYIGKMTGLSRAQVTRPAGGSSRQSTGGGDSPSVTRGPTSSCWPRSTRRTKP
jgi:hypothetical protein